MASPAARDGTSELPGGRRSAGDVASPAGTTRTSGLSAAGSGLTSLIRRPATSGPAGTGAGE